jgi:hypothetical protein
MTGWDVLDKFISSFPPIAATALFVAAMIVFIIGFSRRGFNFIKYGFGKMTLDETFEKRFDRLDERLDGMDARLTAIETNHFGHLKNFLCELTSILLDKNVINNTDKARLDNQLRDM